jgi:hypothetical protein
VVPILDHRPIGRDSLLGEAEAVAGIQLFKEPFSAGVFFPENHQAWPWILSQQFAYAPNGSSNPHDFRLSFPEAFEQSGGKLGQIVAIDVNFTGRSPKLLEKLALKEHVSR